MQGGRARPAPAGTATGTATGTGWVAAARARPVVPALLGAAATSSSAVLVQLADGAAGTAGFFRCALALPGLYALAWWEGRRRPARPLRDRVAAVVAGLFLGVDLVLWTHSIYDVGAGIATVLGNLQVLFVAAIAWALLGERPRSQLLTALPVVLVGVVLVGGLVGHSEVSRHPLAGVVYGLGTSLCYALFILVLRKASSSQGAVAGPLADASAGGALAALALGAALHQIDFHPPAAALGWYLVLALVSQTLGWMLITSSLPRLPAAVSSVLLLVQPAASLLLAYVVLGQRPSPAQVVGAALVCGGVLMAAGRAPRPALEAEPLLD